MSESSANGGTSTPKRKLIEVALPLEAINRESAREKSIRHGHPSTLHLWWARRPLGAARAVLFAQLVDDPSSYPGRFPTEEAQRAERERLHRIIERLVVWENTRDQALLDEAHQEILNSTGGNPPAILDPFAGGGTIPLEAQRLGLQAQASDLNPVAVLINKALIQIPPKFASRPPVCPGVSEGKMDWPAANGLAADVRAYAEWMRDRAVDRIGHYYPKAKLSNGDEAVVIAWIWARTATCPNHRCGAEVPLVSSLDLGRKRGQERWLRPVVTAGQVDFDIASGPRTAQSNKQGQGAHFKCWVCDTPLGPDEVHGQLDSRDKPPARLLAVVAAANRQRVYLKPDHEQLNAADRTTTVASSIRSSDEPLSPPTRGTFGGNAQGRRYGFFSFSDYFTDRQLLALTTFSDLVIEARERVLADSGGDTAYADAIATYLAFGVDKLSLTNVTLATWQTNPERLTQAYSRQAISMTWDFAEANPLSNAGGGYALTAHAMAKVLEGIPAARQAEVHQADAATRSYEDALINTDPPYYDNIVYSDLSDYFYVWLRRSLRRVYPDLLSTVLVPKAEELVANPYRHDGKVGAQRFFEDGFRQVFARARKTAVKGYPTVVWYAFKQSESGDDGEVSTGWETLLEGMIRSGWEITSTWPVRSELVTSLKASVGALASSIVLSLRPRRDDAPTTDRRGLIQALHDELPDALRKLQQGAIAPVDLPQAAIGPGMAVFSRYSKVIETDGSTMTVRSALARINEILDQVLNEQEGDFDNTTRFAIAWYRQHGYVKGDFGSADNIARARNTSVDTMVHAGILTGVAGKVELFAPDELPEDYDVLNDDRVGVWEVLHHLIARLERGGLPEAGDFLAGVEARPDAAVDVELAKELAFLLFSIAEKNGWTQDALAFNTVATAWPDIVDAARSRTAAAGTQTSFDLEER